MTTTEQVKRDRERHHAALAALAASLGGADKPNINGLQLWRKLNRIEQYTHRACEEWCNGIIGEDGIEKICAKATDEVKRVFGGVLPPQFHINRDPRGYALKLYASDDGRIPATSFDLHQDWGRNQILAPVIE